MSTFIKLAGRIFGLFVLPIYIILLSQVSSSSCLNMSKPKIEIDIFCTIQGIFQEKCYRKADPMDSKTFPMFPVFGQNNTLVVNPEQDAFIGIQCVAQYPVEWVHFQEQWLASTADNWIHLVRSQTERYMRSSKKFTNSSTFTYTSLLGLHNIQIDSNKYVVGRYTCQSMNNPTLPSAQMTVYRDGNIDGDIFPLSRRNVTVWTNERNDETIVFPCHVSHQNVSVKLYRKVIQYLPSREIITPKKKLNFTNFPTLKRPVAASIVPSNVSTTVIETWDRISISDRLSFKPDQGFIFQKSNPNRLPESQLPPGIYKCTATDKRNELGEDADEFVIINLKDGNKPEFIGSRKSISLGGRAGFNYSMFSNDKTFQITCCSNTTIAPNMYMVSCLSKRSCDKQMRYFSELEMGSNGAKYLSSAVGNCRKSVHISFAHSIPLNVRCIGDGIDYSETLIFPVVNDTSETEIQPYVRWEDVVPHNMLSLTFLNWKERSKKDKEKVLLYTNQKVNVQCATNTAYFAIGSRITVDLGGGEKQLVADEPKIDSNVQIKWGLSLYHLHTSLQVGKEITSVSCYAAVVNSSQWIRKTVQVHVEDGKIPKIEASEDDVEEIFWTLNDTLKKLECQFSGIPTPQKVQWRKDNKVITFAKDINAEYNHTMILQNTSILHINVATYEIHGLYECVVENMFGNATKTFRVYIRAPETWWIFMSTSFGLVFFCFALILLAIQTWRKKQHHTDTKHLFQLDHDTGFMQ